MDISNDQFKLMQGITAHPDDPSIDDLHRMFPGLNLDTIQEELHELARKGIVEIGTDTDIRRYRLIEDHTDVQESGLFAARETLQHYFRRTG